MRKIYVTSEATQVIDLGRRRENGATQVIFDLYPRDGYAVTIMVLRPGDTQPYPASDVVLDTVARKVVWTITSTDTYRNGAGSIQYRYEDAHGRVVKTKMFRTFVSRSVDCEAGTPPDAYSTWLETLVSQGAQTSINAQAAAQAAANAETSAQNAECSENAAAAAAENASQSEANAAISANTAQTALVGMTFVSFEVSDDGHVRISNGDLLGTTSFELTENGHLEVTC